MADSLEKAWCQRFVRLVWTTPRTVEEMIQRLYQVGLVEKQFVGCREAGYHQVGDAVSSRIPSLGSWSESGYHVYNYVLCDKGAGKSFTAGDYANLGVGELVEHRWSESDVVSFWELVRGDRGGGEEHYGTLARPLVGRVDLGQRQRLEGKKVERLGWK